VHKSGGSGAKTEKLKKFRIWRGPKVKKWSEKNKRHRAIAWEGTKYSKETRKFYTTPCGGGKVKFGGSDGGHWETEGYKCICARNMLWEKKYNRSARTKLRPFLEEKKRRC